MDSVQVMIEMNGLLKRAISVLKQELETLDIAECLERKKMAESILMEANEYYFTAMRELGKRLIERDTKKEA